MHDPFQTYQATQYGSPYMGLQNPLATLNPFGGINPAGYGQHGGTPGYGGIHPQLQLLASILQNPLVLQSLQTAGLLQNPQLQNPLLQNPLLQNAIQNPLLAQTAGYGGSPFGQQHTPFQQFGQFGQYGQGLAPQTWIGQGAPFGGRPFQTPGIAPWAGF